MARPDPTFHKKLVVFKYMGHSAPADITQKDDYIVMSGILPDIALSVSESQIRQEICEVIQPCSEHVLGLCGHDDFEFINMSDKHASVQNHKPGFVFTANAVKKLAGGGSVYVRLMRYFALSSSSSSSDSELTDVHLRNGTSDVTIVKVEHSPPVAGPSLRPGESEYRTQPMVSPCLSQSPKPSASQSEYCLQPVETHPLTPSTDASQSSSFQCHSADPQNSPKPSAS